MNNNNILVSVVGTVAYAKEDPRLFSQTFVLSQTPQGSFVLSDCFRLTTPPDTKAKQ